MNQRLTSIEARWQRRLNTGLVILWCFALWRTGLVAFGYAVIALLADLQAVIGEPLPQTFSTRHPAGLMIELKAGDLRDANWVSPHLAHASHIFVLGGMGSLSLWLFILIQIARARSLFDPVFSARIERVTYRAEQLMVRAITGCSIRRTPASSRSSREIYPPLATSPASSAPCLKAHNAPVDVTQEDPRPSPVVSPLQTSTVTAVKPADAPESVTVEPTHRDDPEPQPRRSDVMSGVTAPSPAPPHLPKFFTEF